MIIIKHTSAKCKGVSIVATNLWPSEVWCAKQCPHEAWAQQLHNLSEVKDFEPAKKAQPTLQGFMALKEQAMASEAEPGRE